MIACLRIAWHFINAAFALHPSSLMAETVGKAETTKETSIIASWKRLHGTRGRSRLEKMPNHVAPHAWLDGPVGKPNRQTKSEIIFGSTATKYAMDALSRQKLQVLPLLLMLQEWLHPRLHQCHNNLRRRLSRQSTTQCNNSAQWNIKWLFSRLR